MGITSFTLNGLGVDAAASGVSGTVPRPRERVKATAWDFSPGAEESRLRGRNQQLLTHEEAIAIGKGIFFQDRLLRYAEAGGDPRERVPFTHDVALPLTRSGNRWRARGGRNNHQRRSRWQGWRHRFFPAGSQQQGRGECQTGDPDRARLISRGQNARRPVARGLDSSGHV